MSLATPADPPAQACLYPLRFEPIYEYRLGAVIWSAERDRDGAGTRATTAYRPGAGELDVGNDPALRPSTSLGLKFLPSTPRLIPFTPTPSRRRRD
jgi:hypothetical protein